MKLITPFTPFKRKATEEDKPKKQYHDYRGFSTSISHSFAYPREWNQDACALACCGLLQKDRNTYLVTGATPPSCAFRFLAYVFLPLCVLLPGLYLVMRPRVYGMEYGLGIALIVTAAVYALFQICRTWSNREHSRREVLLHKDKHIRGTDGGDSAEETYLNGQTAADLTRAHALCGCYNDDVLFDDMEAPLPEELCGGFWQFLMGCCCGRFGGMYVQCCGMCGVAQETRELNRLFHPHQRAVDYLTMQPVLEYYSDILAHRHNEKSTIFQHNRAISSLSFQILVAFGLAFAATFFFCLVFMVWMPQFLMIVAVFTVATLFVYGIHIRFGVMNLCTDAVIKAFAAGFCIASSMSMPLIGIIGLILHGVMYVLLNTIGNGSHGGYGWYYSDDDSFDTEVYVTPFVTLISDVNDEFDRQMPTTHLILLFFQCFFVAAFVQELTKYLAFRMASLHPDFWSKKDLDKVLDATDEEGEGGALVDLDILPEIPLGAQSRTFSARCYTILVASISVSVGVGCFDDLLYAAMYHNRGFHWRSLLFRIFLLSIHPVCAAWQALGISQFDVALDQEVQTGFIVFPAVISHGLFDFSILLGEYLIAEGLVGKNDVVQGLTRYLLPVIVLVASLVLVIFRFDVQQIKMRRKDKEGNYDYEGQPLGNTWSWELLPSEVVEPEVPEKTVERVPLSQRRKVVRIRSARGPSEMELPATIIDENIYNQFGIRTVSTVDMSVEEVIKKFGVLESSPSYTPPVVAQSKSGTSANGLPRSESPSLAAATTTRQPLIAAPNQQHAVAQHPQVQIDNTPPPAIFQVPITESGGSRAYGEAMAILGNRAKAPNVPFPKAMPHMNTAASSSDNRLSTAMVSLNTPIDKRNMYAADACAAKETVSQQTEADKPPGAP